MLLSFVIAFLKRKKNTGILNSFHCINSLTEHSLFSSQLPQATIEELLPKKFSPTDLFETPVSWSAQTKKKSPEDYAKDRAKYAQYFKGNKILPIPELVEAVQPKTLSFIVTDLKTRRLADIKKYTFEELLKAAGIPARFFCMRSFATRDAWLPSEELATKLAFSTSARI